MKPVRIDKYSLESFILRLRHIFFILFIICIPFQDFGLQDSFLRFAGATLSNIPLIGLIITLILGFIIGERIDKKTFMITSFIIIYILAYSLIVLLLFIDDSNILFYIYKLCSNFILFLFYMTSFIYTKNHTSNIKKYIILAYIINLIGWIICDILSINLGSMIHYVHDADYNRFHGFTLEASYFCFTSVILGILSMYYTNNKIIKSIILAITVIIVLFGGSKGTLIIICISILLYILFSKKYNVVFKISTVILGTLVSIFVLYYFLINTFILDLETSTSFASRCSSIIATFFIIKDYPLGIGFGAFLAVFKYEIVEAFNLLNSYIPIIVLNFNEI